MGAYTTADIRNIVITGHAGAGKTSLVERLLHDAGVIGRMGTIEEKNTVCDFEEEEKAHGHSLSSAVAHLDYEGKRINVVDTPGYPDFLGQAIPALPAGDTVAVVIDAARGIETVTRRMMAIAGERNLPRMIIINKIDHQNIDLPGLVAQVRETFGNVCLPVNLPSAGGESVVDCFGSTDGESDFSTVAEAHTQIVDQAVEVNEALMAAYLESGSVEPAQLHDAFEQALREGHLAPILFCSSRTGAGIKELLHFISHLCPNPTEGNPRTFMAAGPDGAMNEWQPTPDASKPVVAHVFKVSMDPFVGKIVMLRVHQGTMKANTQLHRNDDKKALRIGHIVSVQGKDHKEVGQAVAGDIIAVAKIEELKLNDVLHEAGDPVLVGLKPLPMPKPMFGVAIEPKSRGDEAKVGSAVHKLMDEDPTFVVERVVATGQTVARGLGELHLRMLMEKLKGRYGIEVTTSPQKVAYKETIASKAEGHHRHKKQTGGAGQFGEVYLRVMPLPQDHETGFEFADETFGGSVPKQFMPAIEKGVRQVLQHGAVAGYPMTGVRVEVYDGKHHPVDSKEVAFVAAGKKAFIDAVQKARPILLEPFVHVEVTAPADNMGDLTADIAGKRGRIQGTDMLPGDMCTVKATVPLAEVMNYTSQLKSMTGGQGTFTMDYSHDEQTPPNVQAEVVAAYKPKEEED